MLQSWLWGAWIGSKLSPERECRPNNDISRISDGRAFGGVRAVVAGNRIALKGPEDNEQVILRAES